MRPLAEEERRRRLHGMVGGRGKSRAEEGLQCSIPFQVYRWKTLNGNQAT
ncbi:hypothetical protein AAG906_009735 [Vitis piasezkii]